MTSTTSLVRTLPCPAAARPPAARHHWLALFGPLIFGFQVSRDG